MDTPINSEYKVCYVADVSEVDDTGERKPLVEKEVASVLEITDLKTWRKYLVAPIVFFYMIGYMVSYYLIIEYTNNYWMDKKFDEANLTRRSIDGSSSNCNVNKSSSEYKAESLATSISSRYIMYFSLVEGIPAIFSTLILGSLTDFKGRKILFAAGITGTAVRMATCFLVIYLKLDLLYIIPVSFIEGCTGQYCTTLQASFAYASDVTSGRARTYAIAGLVAVLGMSLVVSSFSSGFLINAYGFYVPFAICAIILFACLIVVVVLLPESLPPEKRKRNNEKKSLCSIISNGFSFLSRSNLGNNRWKFLMLFAAHGFAEFSFLGRVGVETIYQMSAPFCWSADRLGIYAAIRTALQVSVGIGSIRFFQICLSDVTIAMLGCISYAITFLGTALATNSTILYIVLGLNALGVMESTMVRSVCSSLADQTQQGAVFSSLAAIEMVVNLLSNVGNSAIYSLTTYFMRGFVFFILCAFATTSSIILFVLQVRWKMEKRNLDEG